MSDLSCRYSRGSADSIMRREKLITTTRIDGVSLPFTMNFTHISACGIDVSPFQSTKKITLALEDSELITVSEQQIERFWNVWYTNRHKACPALESVTLVLRSSFVNDQISFVGINRFLQHFHDIHDMKSTNALHIYIDEWTHRNTQNECLQVLNGPMCVYS